MERTPFNSFIAFVTNIVDADTFDVEIDLGFNITFKARIRISNFDAPEAWRPINENESIHAEEAIQRANELLQDRKIILVSNQETGMYGRYLAEIHIDGKNYSEIMINEGYSKRDSYEEET